MNNNILIDCLKILKESIVATDTNITLIKDVNASSVVWVLNEAIEEVKRHTLDCYGRK